MLPPSFAADPATAAYYDRRAAEYDDWYTGQGLFAERHRPGWQAELDQVVDLLGSLPALLTLDVACGTGFLTAHLGGTVVGIDQSPAMVAIARQRLPGHLVMMGDALRLPVPDGAFDRALTGHFYGHLPPQEREAFLCEARRVAGELVVVDSARRPGTGAEQWQERILNDGSRHRVYKRYLSGAELADEIGGRALMDGRWFVVAVGGSTTKRRRRVLRQIEARSSSSLI
jgi:demethylmenaquinone methyltransferase/2-methoxy-6-polyprenyl-1,4-benzoquinol methylase